MGWVVGRTSRLGELAAIPEVQEIIQRVVTHLDNFCAVERIEPNEIHGNVVRTRALRYITIQLGARACWACEGTGVRPGYSLSPCTTCDGTGVR